MNDSAITDVVVVIVIIIIIIVAGDGDRLDFSVYTVSIGLVEDVYIYNVYHDKEPSDVRSQLYRTSMYDSR